jgi:hypothetical protein
MGRVKKKPMEPAFKPGDRVKATLYGVTGTGGRSGLYSFEGVVRWAGTRINAWGDPQEDVDVLAPNYEGHEQVWFLKASEVAPLDGAASAPTQAAPQKPATAEPSRTLPPGSYGDHKDPRGAMQRLADTRLEIDGKRCRVRKTPERAMEQLDEWCDDNAWQALCPEGHFLGRSPDNLLDIGVWSND